MKLLDLDVIFIAFEALEDSETFIRSVVGREPSCLMIRLNISERA